MNLRETIESLSKVITEDQHLIKNEESTKQFLILPFLKGLGYDTYSPQEVTPEFTADFHKKNEKVDYAISFNSVPKIFIEAKSITNSITKSAPQLSRYFSTFPSVRLGILTNGTTYQFFTDLNHANIMDSKPFFIFNIVDHTEEDFENLIKFSKNLYDEETIRKLAESLIYFASFKSVIKDVFEDPSDDFIKFVIKERFKFKVTQQFIQTSRPLIQKAIKESIADLISEKFGADLNIAEPKLLETPVEEIKKVYYTQEELDGLGKLEAFEDIQIVMPNSSAYQSLLNVDEAHYSVEKGNPLSDFFVASVVTQGSTIFGYLIGQYMNNKEDIQLYTVKASGIALFLEENPVLKETGFINARLNSRINRTTNEPIYYLRSCLPNLSFLNIPYLVTKYELAGKFF